MIYMTKRITEAEILNEVKTAYQNNRIISVVKGRYATEYQKINNNTCKVMCYNSGHCDYAMPEKIRLEDIERIFSNENIKYGYIILIINDSHMAVEQELILKNEYLSN